MRSFVLFFVNVLGTVIQLKDNDWKKTMTVIHLIHKHTILVWYIVCNIYLLQSALTNYTRSMLHTVCNTVPMFFTNG